MKAKRVPPKPKPIPEVIQLVIDAAGIDAAVALVSILGGRKIYIAKAATEGHPIAAVAGMKALEAIVARHANVEIAIPMRGFDVRKQLQIRMVQAEKSNDEIVRVTRCSYRSVTRLRAELEHGAYAITAGAVASAAPRKKRADEKTIDWVDALHEGKL